jgi:hypothetical protein
MEIADRSAIASGFSLSEIGTGGGSGLYTGGLAGGGGCEWVFGGACDVGEGDRGGGTTLGSLEATGARCAKSGVTGEYGGRGGVPGVSGACMIERLEKTKSKWGQRCGDKRFRL